VPRTHDYSAPVDNDLIQLEQKLATLLAHTRAMRVANESLRNDRAAAQERNRTLASRMQEASARLDELLNRLPTP
jgi:primosomal protein N''